MDYSSFMGMIQLPDVPEEASEEILDKTNQVEVLGVNSSSFMEMMELLDILKGANERK